MSKIRQVLVTGASGFIGSHLVEFLLKKNKVKAFVIVLITTLIGLITLKILKTKI